MIKIKRNLLSIINESLKYNEFVLYNKPYLQLSRLSTGIKGRPEEVRDKNKEITKQKLKEYYDIHRVTPNKPYCPWTPTKDLVKKKNYFKRMAFLLQVINKFN